MAKTRTAEQELIKELQEIANPQKRKRLPPKRFQATEFLRELDQFQTLISEDPILGLG